MKHFKRTIALFLVVVILVTTFSACSSFNLENMDNVLTKGEWVEDICNYFGIEADTSDSQYFTNITVNDEIYPYVQAVAKWNIVDTTKDFDPDEKITKEYASATAVKALGQDVTGLEEDVSDKTAAKYAVDYGIAESSSWIYMHEGVTQEDADTILNNATGVYTQREFEEYDNSEYKDNVQFQEDTESYRVDNTNNTVTADSSKNEYAVGDVVVFGEGFDEKAVVITGTSTSDGKTVLSTRDAEINEVMDSIDMSGTGTVESADDIETVDGVELESFNGETLTSSYETPEVETLGKSSETDYTDVAKHTVGGKASAGDLSFKVELSSGKVSASLEAGSVSGSVENKNTKLDENGNEIDADTLSKWEDQGSGNVSSIKSETKGGYKITGSFKLDDLVASAMLKFNTTDVFGYDTGIVNAFDPADSFDVNIDTKITNNLTLSGYFSKTLTIATVPIQAGPVTIKIKVKLYVKVDGSLGIKVVYYNSNSVSWSKKNGFKRVSHTDTEKDLSIEVKIEVGATLDIGIGALGFEIIDVSASVGIQLKISFKMNDLVLADEGLYKHGGDEQYLTNAKDVYLLCFDATLTLPIVKLGVNTGDSLFAKLDSKLKNVKLSIEWTIMGDDDALIKAPQVEYHYEINNGFVNDCLEDSLTQYKKDEEETTDESSDDLDDTMSSFNLDKYSLDIDTGNTSTVKITSLPDGCKTSDIKASTEDSSIAKVTGIKDENGTAVITVKGLKEGTTSLNITCNKSGDSANCTVIVIGE